MRIILTSVNYADYLAVSIGAWKAFLPAGALTVATSPSDVASQQVARDHGVPVFVTDAWDRLDASCHQGGPVRFNMALGLDEALGLVGDRVPAPIDGELIGHVNPDCVPFGRFPDEQTFASDTVYAFWRHECLKPKHLAEHISGVRPLAAFPKLKNSGGAPIGYFQIFRAKAGRRFGSYPTAGKFDTHFTAKFPHKVMRTDAYLLHLGPISIKENWAGRCVPTWGAA